MNGTAFTLEDGMSFMSINEALMWRRVNSYSPLFTGEFMQVS